MLLLIPEGVVVVIANYQAGVIHGYIRNLKTISNFALSILRGTFVSLVGILVEDCGVVFLWVLAALEH